jgi:hypothetical protein
MLWWYVILAVSAAVVVAVTTALYLRVRRHMKASNEALQGTLEEVELERANSSALENPK